MWSCVERLPQLFNLGFPAGVNQSEARLNHTIAPVHLGRRHKPQRSRFRQPVQDGRLVLAQEAYAVTLESGSLVLICSDGLHGVVEAGELHPKRAGTARRSKRSATG